jgi:osmotically-inducible protein OsmY
MKSNTMKCMICAGLLALTPWTAIAGGTTTQHESTTGYSKDPDRGTKQGDMGSGVGDQTHNQGSAQLSDSDLTKHVEDALKKDSQLQNLDIGVSAQNGVVTLSGTAKDVRFKGRAAKVASSVNGVKSVKNNMSVGK